MKPYFTLPLLFSLIFCCNSCKDTKSTKQKEKENDAIEEIQRAADKMKADQAKAIEKDGGISGDPKSMDGMIEATKKLEEVSTGDEAKSAKVMRIFMQSIQTDMAEITKQQQNLVEGTNYSNVKTAADLDALSNKVKLYQTANATLMNKVKSGWEQSLRSGLAKEGVKQSYTTSFMRGVKTGLDKNKPHLLVIRQTDDEMCQAILAQHAVLKKYLGKWKWNAAEGAPDFQDNAALQAYNAQAVKIQNASTRQLEAQKKVVQ